MPRSIIKREMAWDGFISGPPVRAYLRPAGVVKAWWGAGRGGVQRVWRRDARLAPRARCVSACAAVSGSGCRERRKAAALRGSPSASRGLLLNPRAHTRNTSPVSVSLTAPLVIHILVPFSLKLPSGCARAWVVRGGVAHGLCSQQAACPLPRSRQAPSRGALGTWAWRPLPLRPAFARWCALQARPCRSSARSFPCRRCARPSTHAAATAPTASVSCIACEWAGATIGGTPKP